MGKGIVKLGEGNWAVKDGNLLAAKETNGRFKNAEFTVARGTDATYVGRDGLIVNETGDNTPRIDFTNNTDGHLLLEPQSTNLITYSEDFSQWSGLLALSIGLNQGISPNGSTEANLLSIGIDSSATRHRLYNLFSFVEGDSYTYSLFAKKNENDWLQLMFSSSAFDVQSYANFDLNNGVVGNEGTSTTADIIDYGNGWYRCSITCTASASVTTTYEVLTTNNTNSGRYPSYQSSAAVNVCFLWGAQLEALSYATSYIPTNGSTVTRDAETCTGAGSSADFNSEEGVLYAEIAALANSNTVRYLGLNDGSSNNRVVILNDGTANRIRAIVSSGGTKYADLYYNVTDVTDFHKVAVKYKANDFALWIDGVERATDTSGSAPIGLNDLDFELSGGNFYGKCKAIRVYKDALSDSELTTLTS
jgi:hypothetical protein